MQRGVAGCNDLSYIKVMLPTRIGGRYEVERELGRGGMGAVFLVRDRDEDARLALKVLLGARFSESGLRHFEQEFRTLAALSHPHLTEVHRFGRVELTDGTAAEVPFFTMEYVDGKPLDVWFADAGRDSAGLLPVLAQVGQALAYLHDKGLVHRDVKPSNVLVVERAEGPTVKLMDLGLAGRVEAEGSGRIRGTAAYLAPEAARGDQVDPRADLYSLGCVIYELLTGRPPFRGGDALTVLRGHLVEDPIPPSSLQGNVPKAIESLVMKLLAKNPGERPASADRLLEQLDEAAGGVLDIVTPESRRHRVLGGGFIGRERELARLARLVDAAKRGEPRGVLIVGEAGVGKSQLLREFRLRSEIDGFDVYIGHPDQPGGALLAALREASATRPGLPAPLRESLELLLAPSEDGAASDVWASTSRLVETVRALAAERPLALVIEDLHLAGETTCSLLRPLLSARTAADGSGLLVIGTYRGDEVSRSSPLFELLGELRDAEDVEEWFLDPLATPETAALIRARCGADEVPETVLARLLDETGGNPFHVGELLAHLAEEGHIRPGSSDPFESVELENLELPGRVRDLIDRRLSRLDDDTRGLLEAAAVLTSRVIDPDALAGVTGARWERVLELLLELAPGGLVVREGATYRFSGAGIAARVRENTAPRRARELHASTMSYLERRGLERSHASWSAFARHAEAAGQPGRAIDAYGRAGGLARELHAHREAIADFTRAIDLSLRQGTASATLLCNLYRERGETRAIVGELERAEEDFRWMIARAEKGDDAGLMAEGHVALSGVLRSRSHYLEAQENAEIALDLAGDRSETSARALLAVGEIAAILGDHDVAESRLAAALETARSIKHEAIELGALLAHGRLRRDLGDPAGAHEAFRRAAKRAGPRTPLDLRLSIGAAEAEALELQGELERALASYTRTRDEARERGELERVAALTARIGSLQLKLGDPASAGAEFERALDLHRSLGSPAGVVRDQHELVRLHAIRGRYEAARETADEALATARRVGKPDLIAVSLGVLARVHLDVGDVDGARPLLGEARRIVDETRNPLLSAELQLAFGDLLNLSGEPEQAQQQYQEAAFLARRAGDRALESTSLTRLGETHLRANGYDRAQVSARRALAVADRIGLPREAADARLLRARIELERPGGDLVSAEVDALAALDFYRKVRAGERLWRAEHVAGRAELRLARGGEAGERIGRAHRYLETVRSRLNEAWAASFVNEPVRRDVYDDWAKLQAPDEGGTAPGEPALDVGELARARAENDALTRLLEINGKLHAEHDVDKLLGVILDAAIELTGAERGFVLLREGDHELETRQARGASGGALDGDALALSRSIAERVLREGEPLLSTDAEADGRLQGSQSVHDLKIRSVLAVPLPESGGLSGAVYLDSRLERGLFVPFHLELAGRLADQAAIALQTARLIAENTTQRRHVEKLNRELEQTVANQRDELAEAREALSFSKTSFELRYKFQDLIGVSHPMQQVYHLIERLAPKKLPVLITGESGTGKELIARAVHAMSGYSGGPFFTVNCAAINETLLESELFGYRRGAFTGADRDKPGYFELASGGSLFLDEVGEMGSAMQAKLLRAIERGEVMPVGGKATRRVDVRIITATHRDLEALIRENRFREDLYYRFNVGRIHVPPLRDRREDIPLLVDHFLELLAREENQPKRKIEPAALERFGEHAWTGNVRELQHQLLRISAFAGDELITLKDVLRYGDLGVRIDPPATRTAAGGETPVESLEETEKTQIRRALEQTGGNKTRAAKILGINRATLFRKIKRLNLES